MSTSAVVPSGRVAIKAAWPVAVAVLACLPPLLFGSYGVDVVSEIVIFAIVAMSLDFILGYGGLVSFGHAAYFGIGAYATMLLSVKLGVEPWFAMLVSVLVSAMAAGLIGLVCVRASGTGFFMLTLAFAQLLYAGAVKWRFFTGGSDGIGGLPRPHLFGLDLSNSTIMYAVACTFLFVVWLFFTMLVGSPFGHVLVGLRESTLRMSALGYAERPVKLIALVISGAVAGIGGSLYAFYNGFVSPDTFSWGMSGTFLLMVVLGGRSSLVGPIIGAAIFLTMKNLVSSHTDHWLLIVGCVFVGCVMFFPNGVYGLLARRERRPG